MTACCNAQDNTAQRATPAADLAQARSPTLTSLRNGITARVHWPTNTLLTDDERTQQQGKTHVNSIKRSGYIISACPSPQSSLLPILHSNAPQTQYPLQQTFKSKKDSHVRSLHLLQPNHQIHNFQKQQQHNGPQVRLPHHHRAPWSVPQEGPPPKAPRNFGRQNRRRAEEAQGNSDQEPCRQGTRPPLAFDHSSSLTGISSFLCIIH